MHGVRTIGAAAGAVLLALAAATLPAQGQELREITFVQPSPSAINSFPVYVAIGEGYFADEGLQVNVESVNGSSAVLRPCRKKVRKRARSSGDSSVQVAATSSRARSGAWRRSRRSSTTRASRLPVSQTASLSLPATQLLVLSGDNRQCGINEPGEIVIRTLFRTLGYVNAAEEQARRFVGNPFRADAGDVLYRTGDLGRHRPDGTLMVLARLDLQIKIRGVRIEPDEVRATLGASSLSSIVSVSLIAAPAVACIGVPSVTITVSLASSSESDLTLTAIVADVAPAGIITIPAPPPIV